jgi:hypothetical protein
LELLPRETVSTQHTVGHDFHLINLPANSKMAVHWDWLPGTSCRAGGFNELGTQRCQFTYLYLTVVMIYIDYHLHTGYQADIYAF